jgi:hypothetical protein
MTRLRTLTPLAFPHYMLRSSACVAQSQSAELSHDTHSRKLIYEWSWRAAISNFRRLVLFKGLYPFAGEFSKMWSAKPLLVKLELP